MDAYDYITVACILVLILVGFASIPMAHATTHSSVDDNMTRHLLAYEDWFSSSLYGRNFSELGEYNFEGHGFLQQIVVELRIMNYLNLMDHGVI